MWRGQSEGYLEMSRTVYGSIALIPTLGWRPVAVLSVYASEDNVDFLVVYRNPLPKQRLRRTGSRDRLSRLRLNSVRSYLCPNGPTLLSWQNSNNSGVA